ncbi:MAG: hypothetical protein HYS18_02640 [Burkholderiales bacterium]|nr:hypothetical protein [Burkholderiales bacterium]
MKNALLGVALAGFLVACGTGGEGTDNTPAPTSSANPSNGSTTSATTTTTSLFGGTTTTASITTTTVNSGTAPVSWTITDLGPKSGNGAVYLSQNGRALVVNLGNALAAETYVADNGTIVPITREGQYTQVEGYGINDSQVLARSYTPTFTPGGVTSTNVKYFIYSNGQINDLSGTENFNPFPTMAMNNTGQIAVSADFPDQQTTTAGLYSNGLLKNLGSLEENQPTLSTALNDKGEVVGYGSLRGSSKQAAFLYSQGKMSNLGYYSESYDFAHPTAINNAGQITGQIAQWGSETTGHVFLYSAGQMKDLGTGFAFAINNRGQIVGKRIGTSIDFAVLYDGNQVTDLNTLPAVAASGWHLYSATAINDRGQIAGTGTINGKGRAFLLTPVYK